ncbi:hypothetical protein J2795_000981 [Chryseobacterium bernardetii]|uniref:Uncharacterized protein n=2 Tax=Chryseobacterium TaxID=59732 RepID=A0A543ELD3_9FLAO|nr:hypothetical protein [Chryseobacterium vietnamense]MDR6440296.1 hypothetical protein [Chryseobacterium bernardetii]TQM22393.1 hypothetical protein FB551_2106 [Chryseobacterium aquifrigidense]
MNNNYEKCTHSLIPDYLFQTKRIIVNYRINKLKNH